MSALTKASNFIYNNLSPVARVAVYIRAGSRYEPDELPGISHYMRAAAGITTRDSSVFGITRHTERAGASFKVMSDREFIVYRIDCMRDKLPDVFRFIDDTIHKPEFRSWELVDIVQDRLKEDLRRYKDDQRLVTNEALHKAAYRGGLAHATFIPEHQIDRIKNHHLFDFVDKYYVSDRMSFVGLGVDENELKEIVEGRFELNDSQYNGKSGASRYVGGETRIQAKFPQTMVNYVAQGFPIGDTKNLASLAVLSSILGGSNQKYVKYGNGPEKSLLHQCVRHSPSVKASIININYSDHGLFGFSVTGPSSDVMREITKTAANHMKKVLSSVSESDLKSAKKIVRARALINSENQDSAFEGIARKVASGANGPSPLDHLEKLSLKDVQAVANQVLKSQPTMAVVGNPRFVPYIDELGS